MTDLETRRAEYEASLRIRAEHYGVPEEDVEFIDELWAEATAGLSKACLEGLHSAMARQIKSAPREFEWVCCQHTVAAMVFVRRQFSEKVARAWLYRIARRQSFDFAELFGSFPASSVTGGDSATHRYRQNLPQR